MSVDDPVEASTVGPDGPDLAEARPAPKDGTWVGPVTEPARYELLERVGNGGEGELWRGRRVDIDGRPGDFVAVKVHRTADRATLNLIAEQARLLSGVPRDRHVVRVDQVFDGVLTRRGRVEYEDVPVVVMEWIDGRSPADHLRDADVSMSVRLTWIAQLATAVDTLHHNTPPLVHADIKPSNCLVDGRGRLVLVDTGGVAVAGDTKTRRPLHSAGWAAPEVRSRPRAGRTIESDLYSVGAVAYFLLTGQEPMKESAGEPAPRSAYEQLAQMRSTLLAITSVPRRRRRAVADHVLAMLAPDPRDRPGGGGAEPWARRLGELVTRRRRRRRLLSGGGTGAAAAAVAVALVLGTTPGRIDRPLAPFEGESLASWFPAESPQWPQRVETSYTTTYSDGGYRLHPTEAAFVVVPAPEDQPQVPDEVVSATASIVSGQGAWGVWCRGTDPAGTNRYEFQLSHGGAVRITMPDGTATDWVYLRDEGITVDVATPVTLTARCRDLTGAPVELTLAVNGQTVLSHEPSAILGPGYAGLQAMPFSDVPGAMITAEYQQFELRRGRG